MAYEQTVSTIDTNLCSGLALTRVLRLEYKTLGDFKSSLTNLGLFILKLDKHKQSKCAGMLDLATFALTQL